MSPSTPSAHIDAASAACSFRLCLTDISEIVLLPTLVIVPRLVGDLLAAQEA